MQTRSSQAAPTSTSKRYFSLGGIVIVCLLAGGLATYKFFPPGQPTPPLQGAGEAVVATIATAEQSQAPVPPATPADSILESVDTSLIKRLLPSARIRGVEKLDLGMNTWIWEVDMLADESNPQTAGFVYLSADGSKLLNGPLMDKRSKIGLTPPSARAQAAPPPSASSLPAPAAANIGQPAPDELNQKINRDMESRIATVRLQREAFLSGIEQLPYISNTQGSTPVYVMFDPLCSICHKLYKQQESLASAYDIDFRWIPVFNDEKSYPLAGLLRKTYDLDKAKGLAMFDDMMTGRWKSDEHHAEIASLTEGDYGQLGPAAAVYLEANKLIPGSGTPLVFFRSTQGEVVIIGGLPLATDWVALSKPQKS
ncbi:hypothetical protein [Pseudomonas sp. EMN2]|uniref:DsbA family protein n=1 Tax=Pseudomonas sp. EMN2 TaxID=2615212 RepID=UPI00129A6501|nr:hypothetical protein [Pseudomonas sp. EMN2]